MPEDFERYADEIARGIVHADLFRSLDTFEAQEAEWLVPGLIPKGQITTLASDGGLGKTSAWVALAAAISSGSRCFLDPPGFTRKPGRVLFMSSEDSVRVVLKKRLAAAGADQTRITTPDFSSDVAGYLRRVKFGTPELEAVISDIAPDLCIFDPLQGFVPQGCVMGDRAAMRDCMAPLVAVGEKTGTTFLIICHTNKRKCAYGRDRIADSSDLWDISRSVLMMGWTESEGVRYLSHEKCNYGQLQQTILFTIDDTGVIHPEGQTWKRDREYQQEGVNVSAPKRQDCKDYILTELEAAGGMMPVKKLETAATQAGYSARTLRRAKDDLKAGAEIRYTQTGTGAEKVWYVERLALPDNWST